MTPDHAQERTNLIGLSREELAAVLAGIGEKPFRTKQLWHWIYHQGETDFSKMTTLGKELRQKLSDEFTVERPKPSRDQQSEDGYESGSCVLMTAMKLKPFSFPKKIVVRFASHLRLAAP